MIYIKVFTQPGCQPCRRTLASLQKWRQRTPLKANVEVIQITDENRPAIKELFPRARSTPVVAVMKDKANGMSFTIEDVHFYTHGSDEKPLIQKLDQYPW